MDYTFPHTPIPSPEAFAFAKEHGLAMVVVVYGKPGDETPNVTSIFTDVLPRVGETLVIEERKYLVDKVVHRIQEGAPDKIADFFTLVSRVLAVEIEG